LKPYGLVSSVIYALRGFHWHVEIAF
jgi:hypothetical protein